MTHLSPFLIYVFVTTFTPGPNNIVSMSNGMRYGYRNILRFLGGILPYSLDSARVFHPIARKSLWRNFGPLILLASMRVASAIMPRGVEHIPRIYCLRGWS